MHFLELELHNNLLKAISEQGYTKPTLIQEKVIPLVLAGKDVIGSAQTGTGKTAAFALPILQALLESGHVVKRGKKLVALILSPTRELAVQLDEAFKTYAKHTNITSAVVYGGVPIEHQKDALNKGVDILVATPGRLLDLYKQECFDPHFIETLVIDEADMMLDMGFIDDVQKIEKICPTEKQTLFFSATMPQKVVGLSNMILKSPESVDVSPRSSVAKSVEQILYYVPKAKKMELCLHILRNTVKGNIIIFRRTKFGVEKLEQMLLKNGYKAASIHGDKSQAKRQEALQEFKDGVVNILIGTDVASRGIDIENLDAVINFDLPNIPETYVHRIGRTGRAGEQGKAYSFCSADEKDYVLAIQQLTHISIPIESEHPYPLDPNEKPQVHKKKSGSKYRKGRKSEASKKKKKRWY
ncbi:MAG: ATP-dependent RNA helicase RhlE [Crocinitomix sp.]|jgi:ATP-dependent RNA helicase RhlE